MSRVIKPLLAALLVVSSVSGLGAAAQAQYIVVGNDEKVSYDDAGKPVAHPPGKDTVIFLDIKNRTNPKVAASFQLENTIVGPPTNLAITPDEHLALVANSLDAISDGQGGWKNVPDDKVYVFDLKASPPKQIGTIEVGKQPSGMAINHKGDLALIANRADNTVSVLSINGNDVKVIDTVALAPKDAASQQLSSVAITPDGKQALVTKVAANKVALLKIDGQKVTYTGYDMNVGIFPYNSQIASNGKIGIVGNNFAYGSSDGGVGTVGIIDMEATPPRVIDYVVVGDGPEGLAVSPTANLAVSLLLNGGGNTAKNAFYHHDYSYVSILKIDGKKVTKVGEAKVGNFAEGIAFSPDGRYLYVFNFVSADMTIFKVEGTRLMRTGPDVKLPGHPASARSSVP